MTALAPIVKDIADLQAQAAYLEAMAQHHQGASSVASRQTRLLTRLHKRRAAAQQIVASLPDDIRSHGRVVDVLNALESIAARLDRIG